MGVAYVRLPSRVIDWMQSTLEEDTLPPEIPYPTPANLLGAVGLSNVQFSGRV